MTKIECAVLVDDDSITNYLNEELIKELGITDKVKVFENGNSALAYIYENCIKRKKCPELILLDINMPVMDGFEFLKVFNSLEFENKENIKIIMLTTSSNSKDFEQAKRLKVKDYITKPLTPEKLMPVFQKHFS